MTLHVILVTNIMFVTTMSLIAEKYVDGKGEANECSWVSLSAIFINVASCWPLSDGGGMDPCCECYGLPHCAA